MATQVQHVHGVVLVHSRLVFESAAAGQLVTSTIYFFPLQHVHKPSVASFPTSLGRADAGFAAAGLAAGSGRSSARLSSAPRAAEMRSRRAVACAGPACTTASNARTASGRTPTSGAAGSLLHGSAVE